MKSELHSGVLDFNLSAPSAQNTVASVLDVGKSFALRPVLRHVTFTVAAGEQVALFGANGAGKTTLLRILATLTRPTSGKVAICGYELLTEQQNIRYRVGYVGHHLNVYEELTALENMLFFAKLYGLSNGMERAKLLLGRAGLGALANERVRTLSRGQQQRLALIRGIIHSPTLLLLDEPDTGLDEEAHRFLEQLLVERRDSGRTTLFTTHHVEFGLSVCTNVLVLAGGDLVLAGPRSEVDQRDVQQALRYTRRSARV